jgi:hypothetical protein
MSGTQVQVPGLGGRGGEITVRFVFLCPNLMSSSPSTHKPCGKQSLKQELNAGVLFERSKPKASGIRTWK